jgi:ribonuclease III
MENRTRHLKELENILVYTFSRIQLLDKALTHRSFINENQTLNLKDNERLEFLGDAVLDLCISDMLMRGFPDYTEGQLSKIRASIVNETTLAEMAREFQLGNFLLLGKGEELSGGRTKNSILSNAFEAVIAAIYLDGGFDKTLGFIKDLFQPYIEKWIHYPIYKDYKTFLQEFSQNRFKAVPKYQLVHESGPDHDKVFHIKLTIADTLTATGIGKNKKDAEQQAAKQAIEGLQKAGLLEPDADNSTV